MANEVKLVLSAEDNISDVIKKVSDYLGDTGLGESITAVSTGFLAFQKVAEGVGAVLGRVFDTLNKGIQDAAHAENTNRILAMSMQSVGQYTQAAHEEINQWADALELASGEGAETFKTLVSLGVQQGLSAEQSKKAAQAARDLSAATGTDLNTAFQQMAMTMQGSAGKLGKMIPQLQGLTEAELKNGAAIDLISKKYDGFAGKMDKSYSGAMARFDNALGKIPEAFGKLVSQNPAVIAALDKFSTLIIETAESIEEFSTYLTDNAEDLKILAGAFGIATAVVVTYTAVQNAATIATVAAKVATIAFNTAMMMTPYGLIIAAVAALTAGLYFLYKNFDLVAGYIKIGLGYALKLVTGQLTLFLTGLSKVVGFFNAEWAASLDNVVKKISSVSDGLIKSGEAQVAAAQAAKSGAAVQVAAQSEVDRAIASTEQKIEEEKQAIIGLQNTFAKAAVTAEDAFKGLGEFMPRMNLANFQEDAATWKKNIDDLKTQAAALKVKISVGIESEEAKAELEKINQQMQFVVEAEKALKIKTAIETRSAVLAEEEIRLNQQKARAITVEQEIAQMRRDQAATLRTNLIEQEVQTLLEMRNLASLDAQEGMTAKQAALLQANEIELSAFTTKLETEKALAVDMELQKQLAIAEMKASAMNSETSGGADAAQQVEVIQAQMKMAELERLRMADMISEQAYQEQLSAIRIQAIQARTTTELEMQQQKMELLGTSPEALAMALEMEKVKNESELLMLQEKLTSQQVTEDEFRIMKEEAEKASLERQSQIREQHLQRDVEQNTRLKNQWGTTLAQIRLEQEKHGQAMGMIKGIQQSREYGATQQGLSDLASLRSSGDRKAFEMGKAAAIAQAMIKIPESAVMAFNALAGIPLVGPVLGTAAAAAAIAAGMNNVAQIKAQKFQGGQAHAGIDEVPKSMDNSTFLLKAGERVVQPDQNKELGMAIDKINSGGSGGHNISITINGNADESMIMQMKDAVIDAIREASERGQPIMSEKGIMKA